MPSEIEGVIDLDPESADAESSVFSTEKDLIDAIQHGMTLNELHNFLKEYPSQQPISDDWLKELIRLHANETSAQSGGNVERACQLGIVSAPPELKPLVESGQAICRSGHWFVKRCFKCGKFNNDECCGEKTRQVSAVHHGESTLTHYGRQAVGLEPITPPKPPETPEQVAQSWKQSPWWSSFSGVDEMESGGIKMYVENIIPEGVTIISSLPKEGKTWLALSLCKALTSGQPLFGQAGFEVPEPVPVIYLAAEVGDRAFKQRVQKFGITNDKTKFLCRTLTKGGMNLEDTNLEQAIRALQPIVILDVLSCFSQSDDEDNSVENQKLRRMIGGLRRAGARAVIILHHSTKNFKQKPTKENAVRGSGDILAMVDCVWALMLDDRLYQSSQVEEVDVIGWGRDFSPSRFRFGLTRKGVPSDGNMYKNGIISVIDSTHDLGWIDKSATAFAHSETAEQARENVAVALEKAIRDNPDISLRELSKVVGLTYWKTQSVLKGNGWAKSRRQGDVWKKV
jgi:hypothetical protein